MSAATGVQNTAEAGSNQHSGTNPAMADNTLYANALQLTASMNTIVENLESQIALVKARISAGDGGNTLAQALSTLQLALAGAPPV